MVPYLFPNTSSQQGGEALFRIQRCIWKLIMPLLQVERRYMEILNNASPEKLFTNEKYFIKKCKIILHFLKIKINLGIYPK